MSSTYLRDPRAPRRWPHLLVSLAVCALAAAHSPARAQLGAPADTADPATRVAALTDMAGQVSFAPAGTDDWGQAGLNRPITTGDRLWVEGGRAEVHAGATALRLGNATAISVLDLGDDVTQVKLTQGTLQLRPRVLQSGQSVEVDTPNLAFVPQEDGDYRLDVAPDGSATTVSVRRGRAMVYGENGATELSAGARATFLGSNLAGNGRTGLPAPDEFDRWTLARDAREDASASARYLPEDMTGYAQLDDYGDWREEPDYGAVWYPRAVSSGWAPYSEGNWTWVAPWGWTWVDAAPWGFAPSHYGRWARVRDRWCWVPGARTSRPVYAPAVVGFIGGGHPVAVGGGPAMAWYPLGPREVYRPAYHASPGYMARVNRISGGRPGVPPNRDYAGAISTMPAVAFVQGRPVPRDGRARDWRHLPSGETLGAPQVAPVKASLMGNATTRPLPAGANFARPAIAVRPPARPVGDPLARQYAAQAGGVVPQAGPAWHGGRPGAPLPQESVRISRAAHDGGRPMPGFPNPLPGNPPGAQPRMQSGAQSGLQAGAQPGAQQPLQNARGQGWTMRPDQPRGPEQGNPYNQRNDRPDHNGSAQPQRLTQNPQMDLQRVQAEQQRQQQQMQQEAQRSQYDQQRRLDDMQRQQADQQRQAQDQLRRQQDAQQQRTDQQQRQQEAQRNQFDQQRQQQDQQRQQVDQQRQMQDRQRAQQEQQRQQLDQQQRVQQEAQRRQFDQQRQQQDQQRQQIEQQRQMQDQQRQQMDQQRQAQEAQRRQMDQQRQMQDQQRQQQEAQRRQMDQQRQMQDQQRQQQDAQRRQAEQQRQMQDQQRQQQEAQRQQMDQQRQQQEGQRRQMEQQRQQHERQLQEQRQRQAQS